MFFLLQLTERDDLKQKHSESLQTIEGLSLTVKKEKETYDRRHRESLDLIEGLKKQKVGVFIINL